MSIAPGADVNQVIRTIAGFAVQKSINVHAPKLGQIRARTPVSLIGV